VALVFVAELLYYGRWWAWHGDWSWGPRYLVITVPFVMLGWIPLVAGWRLASPGLRALGVALAGAGFAVSLLGVAVDYGGYYSVLAYQIGRGIDVREARLVPEFSPLLGHAWLARASAYDALAVGGGNAARGDRDRRENPVLGEYPWAGARPELVPEAPEQALGFDFWFAAIPDRTPFIEYWSTLVACWLALALVPLGGGLWRAARAPRAQGAHTAIEWSWPRWPVRPAQRRDAGPGPEVLVGQGRAMRREWAEWREWGKRQAWLR
jgi:hypothetical protein